MPHDSGWVEVICGCMFSGKTEELIRRLRRAEIAGQQVVVFKPVIDDRYAEVEVVSHSELRLPSLPVRTVREIEEQVGDAQVIGIDEAQFIQGDLFHLVRRLADRGRRVIVAGLDTDYRGEPFEPMPQLMCEAEFVTKTMAVCHRCGAPAHRTQRIGGGTERVIVGGKALYEARCRSCWEPPDEAGR
ncbi:MAG TPA: thymidine kinase, partial [Bacteroidetes bacterium]|nr:thymidine kinase [Bacteroidota bacterium]